MTDMSLELAIKIMNEQINNPIARAYLSDISGAVENGGMFGLRVQLEYILTNSKSWKGEEARQVKSFVRCWIQEKKNEAKN